MKKTDELRKIARELLSELENGDEEKRSKLCEKEEISRQNVEFNDTLDAISRQKRYYAQDLLESNGILEQQNQTTPRTTRRQFLAQRLLRRDKMENAESAGGTSVENFSKPALWTDELSEAGEPARLSEIYRRDARRYDGPFERY